MSLIQFLKLARRLDDRWTWLFRGEKVLQE